MVPALAVTLNGLESLCRISARYGPVGSARVCVWRSVGSAVRDRQAIQAPPIRCAGHGERPDRSSKATPGAAPMWRNHAGHSHSFICPLARDTLACPSVASCRTRKPSSELVSGKAKDGRTPPRSRRRDKAGKLYPPAVQRMVSEQMKNGLCLSLDERRGSGHWKHSRGIGLMFNLRPDRSDPIFSRGLRAFLLAALLNERVYECLEVTLKSWPLPTPHGAVAW